MRAPVRPAPTFAPVAGMVLESRVAPPPLTFPSTRSASLDMVVIQPASLAGGRPPRGDGPTVASRQVFDGRDRCKTQDSELKSRRARIETAGILLYFEDFEPKPDNEFSRQPKFCNDLWKGVHPASIAGCRGFESQQLHEIGRAAWHLWVGPFSFS